MIKWTQFANIILIYNLLIEFQFLVLIESFVYYIPEISISIEILFGQIVWIQSHQDMNAMNYFRIFFRNPN